jgi:hypothetical protein
MPRPAIETHAAVAAPGFRSNRVRAQDGDVRRLGTDDPPHRTTEVTLRRGHAINLSESV